ncbi:hypothetical protein GOODEAATRI_017995 [Goodea atripinnis]|uniref:Uncharacterized protein n=1 Tax=Goodea atripinnis TaxID=208336 RepID=A0ABV0PEZ9_9TELE
MHPRRAGGSAHITSYYYTRGELVQVAARASVSLRSSGLPAMVASSVHGALLLGALFQLFPLPGGQAPNCQEVRTAFHALHPGSKWVPENPVSGNYHSYHNMQRMFL